jgi:hypothetical protein
VRILAGRVARFWLSPEGGDALLGILDKQAFQAFVEATDEFVLGQTWEVQGRDAFVEVRVHCHSSY